MKRLFIAAALVLAFVTILHAEEQPQNAPEAAAAPQSQSEKDECILNSKDCGDQAISIQSKIERLKQEIQKGTKVYTPKEVQKLKNRLRDAEDVLDELLFHPTNN